MEMEFRDCVNGMGPWVNEWDLFGSPLLECFIHRFDLSLVCFPALLLCLLTLTHLPIKCEGGGAIHAACVGYGYICSFCEVIEGTLITVDTTYGTERTHTYIGVKHE